MAIYPARLEVPQGYHLFCSLLHPRWQVHCIYSMNIEGREEGKKEGRTEGRKEGRCWEVRLSPTAMLPDSGHFILPKLLLPGQAAQKPASIWHPCLGRRH